MWEVGGYEMVVRLYVYIYIYIIFKKKTFFGIYIYM